MTSWQAELEDEMRASRRELTRAATSAMGDWISQLAPWTLFGGLTFDPKRCEQERVVGTLIPRRIPVDVAAGRFKRWMRASEKALGRGIVYVAALESHKNGWPHLHPLLSLEGGIQAGDVATLGMLWFQANGVGRLEVPRAMEAGRGDAAKSLAKAYATGPLLLSPALVGRTTSAGPIQSRSRSERGERSPVHLDPLARGRP